MNRINLESIIPILESNDVEFAAVFGSAARGEAKDDSDVDVLVRFNRPKSLIDVIGLERILSEELGKKVDLVTEGGLSPYIRENVMRDLKTIHGTR